MILIVISLLAVAPDGPPPYVRSLQCAGLTRGWAELEAENRSAGARLAQSDAEFWAFAAMDAARRDGGVTPPQVEAGMDGAAAEARKRFQSGDDKAARDLLGCQMLIPQKARGIDPVMAPRTPD